MGMEQNGSGRKGNKDKRRQKRLSPVQRLYETCKEVFADCSPGIVPSPQNVEKLAAVLGIHSLFCLLHSFLFERRNYKPFGFLIKETWHGIY